MPVVAEREAAWSGVRINTNPTAATSCDCQGLGQGGEYTVVATMTPSWATRNATELS